MTDDFLVNGRERRVLRDALRATEDALLEIDGAASGERKVTPEALARGLREILAGQAALMEALLGAFSRRGGGRDSPSAEEASGAPGSTKRREAVLGGPEGLQRFLDDARGVSGEAPGEARAAGVSEGASPPSKKDILSPRERAERAARFAARIGKGFKDDDSAPAGDAPPKLRPLTLDDEDDLSALEAAQPRKRSAVEPPPPVAATPTEPTPEPSEPSAAASAYTGKRASDPVASLALETFPLEEMNRWLASGTVFQIRGAMAFLNMNSMGGTRIVEMSGNIRRMGFSDELGRLDAPGLNGSVLLFRRVEGA